ncbi:hypothetical protein LCGC14_1763080, partial [marine sediment metagenome]
APVEAFSGLPLIEALQKKDEDYNKTSTQSIIPKQQLFITK